MHHESALTAWINSLGFHLPDYLVMFVFVMILTLGLAFVFTRGLSVDKPGGGQQVLELVVGMLRNMITDMIPHHGEKYLSWIGPFAIMIFFANFIGLFPWFQPPTGTWLVTIVLGVCCCFTYNYLGVRETGFHYINHFIGPSFELGPFKLPWLLPLFVVLEAATFFLIRPFSLSLRLFANIMGDHQVGSAFINIVPIGVPIPFILLGLLVCAIQTFIFTTLTIVFVSLSVEHH